MAITRTIQCSVCQRYETKQRNQLCSRCELGYWHPDNTGILVLYDYIYPTHVAWVQTTEKGWIRTRAASAWFTNIWWKTTHNVMVSFVPPGYRGTEQQWAQELATQNYRVTTADDVSILTYCDYLRAWQVFMSGLPVAHEGTPGKHYTDCPYDEPAGLTACTCRVCHDHTSWCGSKYQTECDCQ